MLPDGPHKAELLQAIDTLIAFIGDDPLDATLEARLNDRYGLTTTGFLDMERLLRIGIEEGWACYEVIDGEHYRRGLLADGMLGPHEFVLQSARLRNVPGNYHLHPLGEINMIQPVDATGTFCGHGAGWKVFAPGTSHYPTVAGGTVTFIFLLPKGKIVYRAEQTEL